MDDRPPPSRFSSLRSMYGMVPYAVVSLRLFGSEDSITVSLLYYSYPLVARAQGVEPCDLPGVFLGFQL